MVFLFCVFGLVNLSSWPGVYLNKLLFLWCTMIENISVSGVHQFRCFFAFKKLYDGQSLQGKKSFFKLTSFVPCSLFWISWRVKMGSIGCPETSLRNYHSAVPNISEECRSHWWFGDAGIGLLCIVCWRMIWFRAVHFIASYANFRQPHILKRQILGKKPRLAFK